MRIWVIERDHEPMVSVRPFRIDSEGTAAMKRILNSFPTDGRHYYDAVVYEQVKPKKKQEQA